MTNSTRLYKYTDTILVGVILTNLPVVYYFLALISQSFEEQRRLDDALIQTKAQLARYRFTIELEEQLKKERHELKNKYFYLQTLLNEKKFDQMKYYLENVIGKNLSTLSGVQTGNTLMDYIINRKFSEAQKLNIKVFNDILVLNKISINEDTLCTILLNTLDNAIEASKTEKHPELHVTIKCIRNYLVCRISNKSSQDILSENPNLKTTKKDHENHGLGIKIIQNSVEKENGMINFTYTDGYFNVNIMLPFNNL